MESYNFINGLSEKIRNTILASDIDLTTVSKRMGISRSTLYGYMYYDIMPNTVNLMKIACEFNVSADWLLGISEEKHSTEWIEEEKRKRDKKIDKIALGKSVMEFRKSKKLSRPKFCRLMGVDEKTVFNWETGRTVPTEQNRDVLKSLGWEEYVE